MLLLVGDDSSHVSVQEEWFNTLALKLLIYLDTLRFSALRLPPGSFRASIFYYDLRARLLVFFGQVQWRRHVGVQSGSPHLPFRFWIFRGPDLPIVEAGEGRVLLPSCLPRCLPARYAPVLQTTGACIYFCRSTEGVRKHLVLPKGGYVVPCGLLVVCMVNV